jgi:hypothetical protein
MDDFMSVDQIINSNKVESFSKFLPEKPFGDGVENQKITGRKKNG